MLEASPPPIDHFPAFLARLPLHIDLEALARQAKAFQRPRGVRSGTDLMRLALAWGPGGYSMQRVAAWAGETNIATLTEDALIQRLHAAGPFLEEVVRQLLVGTGEAPSWHGRVLRISDSTSLSKPASKGTDWRVHGVYDLGRGGFSYLEVTDGRGGEALDRGKPVAGEIRIGDRGYANAQAWQRFLQARDEQADFIVRMRWNTVRLVDEADDLFDIVAWLQARPGESEVHEVTVWARSGKRQTPMKIRLIARRKPPEVIEAEHKRLRQHASRKQTRLDPRSLIAAEYLVLATSLPEGEFPATEVLAVYRLRWQIELAFKRLKSLLHIGKLRTKTEAGTRCWLYAHLIVALLGDDLSQDFLESFPSGTL
jgi:Transposase DDE domain